MERIETLIKSIEKEYAPLGMYFQGAKILPLDQSTQADITDEETMEQVMVDNPEGFLLACVFNLGEIAFSDRVLNPDEYSEEMEFKRIMPSEAELLVARFEENEGKSFLEMMEEEG